MALELQYLGQNVSLFGPDVDLTGDPSIDNAALETAGYLAGTIVTLKTSTNNPDGIAITPADAATALPVAGTATDPTTGYPFGAIITEPGEFANTIGPAGSNRIAVARAHFVGNLYAGASSQTTRAYDPNPAKAWALGQTLYVGTVSSKKGCWVNVIGAANTVGSIPVGIVTHVPDSIEPWLGVASLF